MILVVVYSVLDHCLGKRKKNKNKKKKKKKKKRKKKKEERKGREVDFFYKKMAIEGNPYDQFCYFSHRKNLEGIFEVDDSMEKGCL